MNYHQYLFSCLFKECSENYNQMEFDIQYEIAVHLHADYVKSEFNKPDLAVQDCMLDYILSLIERMQNCESIPPELFPPSLN